MRQLQWSHTDSGVALLAAAALGLCVWSIAATSGKPTAAQLFIVQSGAPGAESDEYVVAAQAKAEVDELVSVGVIPFPADRWRIIPTGDRLLELRKWFPELKQRPTFLPPPGTPPVLEVAKPATQEDDELQATEALTKTFGSVAARVVRVHDGDTVIVDIPLWPAVVGDQMTVRLAGYDAPELASASHGALAEKARQRLDELLVGRQVDLKNIRRDKYFRLLADYYLDNAHLGRRLADEGLVRPYTGKGPKPWE